MDIKSFSEPCKPKQVAVNKVTVEPFFKRDRTIKLSIDHNSSLKVRPPFIKLPAFNVDAIVLSYIGYEDEVFSLLCLLNKNCHLYSSSHKEVLKTFVVKYKKEITNQLEFTEKTALVKYTEEKVSE